MTESDWLSRNAPRPMLAHLRDAASPRKLRLFACACCRLLWHLLPDERARQAVEMAERYADRRATEAEREEAYRAAWQYSDECGREPMSVAAGWTAVKHQKNAWWAAEVASHNSRCAVRGGNLAVSQARLLRDIFGNPFRAAPAVPRAWLAWQRGTIPRLTQAIYDEGRWSDLPVLADALEEAGCDNADLLAHLRSAGPHVRGCWTVDLLRGRS